MDSRLILVGLDPKLQLRQDPYICPVPQFRFLLFRSNDIYQIQLDPDLWLPERHIWLPERHIWLQPEFDQVGRMHEFAVPLRTKKLVAC
jgi:hypothetical protein